MTEIAGRAAFVTGGASGIGLGIARALLDRGAKVAIVDRDAEALDRALSTLAAPDRLTSAVLDVRDRSRFSIVADAVEAEIGPVSLLFNNAGVGGGAAPERLSYEQWDYSLGINIGGVVNGIQTFLPRLVERGDGHIVNTASGAGLGMAGHAAGGVLYITGKFAVVGMSEALEVLLADKGVGVSVFCPGVVNTNIIAGSASFPPPRVPSSAEEIAVSIEEATPFLAAMANSLDPLDAGRIVLDAVEQNQLFIHTDRVLENAVQSRATQILAAMPTDDHRSADLKNLHKVMREQEDRVTARRAAAARLAR